MGELLQVDKVDPKNDIFMEVQHDVNQVSEHFGSNQYLRFIDPGNVPGLATGSVAGFVSLFQLH
jgi:hypothetical protein